MGISLQALGRWEEGDEFYRRIADALDQAAYNRFQRTALRAAAEPGRLGDLSMMDSSIPKRRLIAAVAFGLLGTVAGFAVSRAIRPVVDQQVPDLDKRAIVGLAVFCLSSVLVGGSFGALLRTHRRLIRLSALVAGAVPALVTLVTVFHWPPLNRAAQAGTMNRMRIVADAIESIHERQGSYPSIRSIDEISQLSGRVLPATDAWGDPLLVSSTSLGYSIASLGADGRPDQQPTRSSMHDYDTDIVLRNGEFVSAR